MIKAITYDRPREKLRAKGVAALSNTELLQIIIGSGNATSSVANIARKTNRVLDKYGSDITYDQLSTLSGIGVARVSLILSIFELAKRFPVKQNQPVINTMTAFMKIIEKVRTFPNGTLVYITLDGGKKVVTERIISPGCSHSEKLRTIILHTLADTAASVLIFESNVLAASIPSIDHLQFGKDIRDTLTSLDIHQAQYNLVSQTTHYTIFE